MNDSEDFEERLRDGLQHKADSVTAPPRSVSTIVRRSHGRRARHRAAGALAGAGALVLGGAILNRGGEGGELSLAAGGFGTSTTTSGTTPGTVPGPDDPTATTVVTVARPTVSSTAPGDGPSLGLVADPNPSALLANGLRIGVDPSVRLADGTSVAVRGSGFPAGAQVLLIECTTHGLGVATLADAAGYCDIASRWDVAPDDGQAVPIDGPGPDVASDGTFTATYRVARNVSTLGGAFDCALGGLSEDAGDELSALLDAGALGAASFPAGAYGCSLVAVVTGQVDNGDGSSTETYLSATAHILHFDPNAPAVPPTTPASVPGPLIIGP